MDNAELKIVLEEMKETYDLRTIREFLDEIVELTDSEDILDLADALEAVCRTRS